MNRIIALSLAMSLPLLCGSPLMAINLTGDPTTTTGIQWSWQGHSLGDVDNPNGVIWADAGTQFGYDVYTASWYLTGSETVSAGVIGNTEASLNVGAFQANDRVVAIGWKLDAGLVAWNNSFFKFDPDGIPGTLSPADSVGGTGGQGSFSANSNAGDYQLSGSPQGSLAFRVVDVRVSYGAGSFYPYQGNVPSGPIVGDQDDLPFRTFTVPYSGSDPNGLSQILLLNVDAMAREAAFTAPNSSSVAFNPIGNELLFYMQLGGVFSGPNYPVEFPTAGATGVVILADVTPVPEPQGISLAGLAFCGVTAFTARRRKAENH